MPVRRPASAHDPGQFVKGSLLALADLLAADPEEPALLVRVGDGVGQLQDELAVGRELLRGCLALQDRQRLAQGLLGALRDRLAILELVAVDLRRRGGDLREQAAALVARLGVSATERQALPDRPAPVGCNHPERGERGRLNELRPLLCVERGFLGHAD